MAEGFVRHLKGDIGDIMEAYSAGLDPYTVRVIREIGIDIARQRSKIVDDLDDPPKLAESLLTEEGKLACYCRVRDEIREYIETLPEALP